MASFESFVPGKSWPADGVFPLAEFYNSGQRLASRPSRSTAPRRASDMARHDFWERANNALHGGGWHDSPRLPTAPLPPPGVPPLLIPDSPQSRLVRAQDAARADPKLQPIGAPHTPEHKTFCNLATCQIVRGVGAPRDGLMDRHGVAYMANDDAKRLASSPYWRTATPQEAQGAADRGEVALGVVPAAGHGHIVTVRPEMLSGALDAGAYGPLVNDIGTYVRVALGKQVFTNPKNQPTWYIPVHHR